MIFLVVHSLYKAALFLMIGIVDHETGTREVDRLRGLARKMPVTFVAGALAAISMAGIPPFFGFIGKEFLYKAGLELTQADALDHRHDLRRLGPDVRGRGHLGRASLPTAASCPRRSSHHEGPAAMWIGPLILGAFRCGSACSPGRAEAVARRARAPGRSTATPRW
jgi:multicomponent Na+:H+ antiporter subunit A